MSVSTVDAANFRPVVTNYVMKNEVRQAGTQNWNICQDSNGNICIANNRGLLLFDGYRWALCRLPGSTGVRSVYADGDSIFVGTYEETGYFKRNETGTYIYHSLNPRVKGSTLHNEDFWRIQRLANTVYFQSFETMYSYDGKTIGQALPESFHPLYIHAVSDKCILIQQVNGSLFRYSPDNKSITPFISRGAIGDDIAVACIRRTDGAIMIFTEYSGIYLYSEKGGISRFATDIDKELHDSQVNRATLTMDSCMIIGTIKDGIYCVDLNGHTKWHVNADNGLLNNTVLDLLCDRDNNIWAALDNGVSLIHTGSPYEVLSPERTDEQIGMVYDIGFRNEDILLPTNQALYSYRYTDGSICRIRNTDGQNWHVSTFGNDIFLGNNTATKKVVGPEVMPVTGITGSSTCMREAYIHGQHILLESSYSTLRVYRPDENGSWKFSHEIDKFLSPLRQIEIDSDGTVWASNINRGIIRIELDKSLKFVSNHRYYQSFNGEDAANFVMKIKGSIVFSDSRRLYIHDPLNDTIIPFEKLNRTLFTTADIHSASAVDASTFWLSAKDNYFLVRSTDGEFKVLRHIPVDFFGMENNEGNDKVTIDGQYVYFNMNNGIGRYNTAEDAKWWHTPALSLSSATVRNRSESRLLPINSAGKTTPAGNLYLRFSYPNYSANKVRFRFILEGARQDTTICDAPEIDFSGLAFGKYTLLAEAIDSSGSSLSSMTYSFIVPRPWFLSTAAILLYIIATVASIFFISRWQTAKAVAKRRKEFELERHKQDIKMLEQEKLIAEQQRQLLESELSEKGKELANMALSVYSREQIINNLKESISTQSDAGGFSRKQMNELLSRIKSNMSDLEFWHIYQKNFDLIHEHFFRNLRERYPTLTNSDLKFCALLRLNLSTKDIAKFTNLTVRGVETARYRLRKKFDLSPQTSLVEFLIDFK